MWWTADWRSPVGSRSATAGRFVMDANAARRVHTVIVISAMVASIALSSNGHVRVRRCALIF